MPIHVKYELTLALSYDFYQSFLRQNRQLRVGLLIAGLLILLAVIIEASNSGFSIESLLAWLLPVGMILLIWIAILQLLAKRQLRRSLKESKMGTERLIILSEENIMLKTEASEAVMKWNAILKTGASRMNYFLYTARNQALIIPRGCLSEENEVELLDLLRRKDLLSPSQQIGK